MAMESTTLLVPFYYCQQQNKFRSFWNTYKNYRHGLVSILSPEVMLDKLCLRLRQLPMNWNDGQNVFKINVFTCFIQIYAFL